MFSKKSLPITIAFILMIALGTMGLAYGAWTDTLTINGNVTTGTLDVDFLSPYLYSADMNGALSPIDPNTCTGLLSGDTLTISIPNAYPGYQCNGSIFVDNTGTIPAKIQPPALISEDLPWDPSWGIGACWGADTIIGVADEPLTCDFNFEIPYSETGHMDEHFSFSYQIAVSQALIFPFIV